MMIDLVHGEPITFGSDVVKELTMGDDGTLKIVNVDDVGRQDPRA